MVTSATLIQQWLNFVYVICEKVAASTEIRKQLTKISTPLYSINAMLYFLKVMNEEKNDDCFVCGKILVRIGDLNGA